MLLSYSEKADIFPENIFEIITIQMITTQLNPNDKAFKYRFDLELIKFKYPFTFPCTIEIVWYRGKNNIKTKHAIDVKGKEKEIMINQVMSSMSTCYFNTETKQFRQKQYEIIVVMNINGSPKRLGMLYVDLCSILDPFDPTAHKSKLFDNAVLLKAPNQSKLVFKLSSTFQESVVIPSEKSIGSQANPQLNTSGFSLTQDPKFTITQPEPKFTEKKSYEIPSKDSYSVTSYNGATIYNSYNTGIRYQNNSAKREGREDSNSVKKQQYGLKRDYPQGYPTSSALRSAGSHEYDVKVQTMKQAMDNRTQNNDGGYHLSKQLTEQQNKRSKLQSELNKNNLYVQELKKKLNEYLILNNKMKQEIANYQKQGDSQGEIFQLNNKVYDMSNQIRDLKSNLDYDTRIIENLEKEKHNLLGEKSHQAYVIENLIKKVEESKENENFMKVNDQIQKENKEMKLQREKCNLIIKDYQRRLEEKESAYAHTAVSANQKYREINQLNAKIEYYKKQLDKVRTSEFAVISLQNKVKEMTEEINRKNKDLALKNQSIYQMEKQITEFKKLAQQFEAEKCYLHREIQNQREEIISKKENDKQQQESEYRIEHLTHENKSLSDKFVALSRQLEDKSRTISKLQQEKAINEVKYNKQVDLIRDRENQIAYHKDKCSKLESAKQESELVINQLKENAMAASNKSLSASTAAENDSLLRETLKMQVELKFAHDQLTRLKGVEELYENQKWRAETQLKNKHEIEKECERIEKELIGKNRALMIETEKSKMLTEQLNQSHYNTHLINQELERSRNIIFNGEKQVTLMNGQIEHLRFEYEKINQQIQILINERAGWANNAEQVKNLQLRVLQLEERNSQKMASLQKMSSDLNLKKNQIEALQKIGEERYRQLMQRDKMLSELDIKWRYLESAKSQLETELSKSLSEKRSLEKKSEMAMQQMHNMKKRFEEEKGRSLSYARSEQYGKVRGLQNQMQKKDKLISKLSKEKLELQQQNVKINVQVMKLLSQMEKSKSTNTIPPTSSAKTIVSLKQH